MATNIPGIIKIEYTAKENVAINYYEIAACESANFTGTFTELEFVPTTAGLATVQNRDESGNLYFDSTLQFFVPSPDWEQKAELFELSKKRHVYRVTDPQGQQYIVGDQTIAARLTFTEQVDPTYTGRRGYAVTVTLTNKHGALILVDDDPSA